MDKSRDDVSRRDATGHLDASRARSLLEKSGDSRSDEDDKAFLRRRRSGEALSEELGEAYLESATSGEEAEPERHDRVVVDEHGGPFVPSTGSDEFAAGTDGSNTKDATREPLPKTSKADPLRRPGGRDR
jgi:hypothetical protein